LDGCGDRGAAVLVRSDVRHVSQVALIGGDGGRTVRGTVRIEMAASARSIRRTAVADFVHMEGVFGAGRQARHLTGDRDSVVASAKFQLTGGHAAGTAFQLRNGRRGFAGAGGRGGSWRAGPPTRVARRVLTRAGGGGRAAQRDQQQFVLHEACPFSDRSNAQEWNQSGGGFSGRLSRRR